MFPSIDSDSQFAQKKHFIQINKHGMRKRQKLNVLHFFAFFMDCLFFMEQVLCISGVSSTTTTTQTKYLVFFEVHAHAKYIQDIKAVISSVTATFFLVSFHEMHQKQKNLCTESVNSK